MARDSRTDDRGHDDGGPEVSGRGSESAASGPSARSDDAGGPIGSRGPTDRYTEREPPVYWRDRAVHLSVTARDTLRTVGTFRTVAVPDLARTVYDGQRDRLERDLRSLTRRGWLERHTLPGRHGGRAVTVVVLSREGHAFARRHLTPDDQTLHWGFVKPKEQAHDAALYRVYQAEAKRITRTGGIVRRVILDAELKGRLAAARNRPHRGDAVTNAAEIARAESLRIVGATVQIPDMRVEYDTREGTPARVDLELATEHYKGSQVAAKAAAGFTIYAPASQTDRLSAALEDRGLITEILSL